jgi:PAS domain S-box-containing protein
MRLKLYARFNLYIGGILLLGMTALIYYDFKSNTLLLYEIGLNEAQRLSTSIFDQLYTSMKLGGGRVQNRDIIERFKREKIAGVDEIRVIHGPSMDKQYGIEEDEIARDELERLALEGVPGREITRGAGGYRQAHIIEPFKADPDCRRCHLSAPGQTIGAISVRVSLKKYEEIIYRHRRNFLFWGGGILVLTSFSILLTVNKRLLEPLDALKTGTEALASGDLSHRVVIPSEDEIGELGEAFNDMASSLSSATGRLEDLSEKYSKLVQMAPDAIVLVDLSSRKFIEANPAATVLTGYSRDALLDMRSVEMYPPEKAEDYSRELKRWVHDGKGYLHDASLVKKDGLTVPIEIGAAVLELGGTKYILEIWRDLSERKGFGETIKRYVEELEGTVKKRTFELNRTVIDLEVAYKRLQDSEQKFIQSAKLISLGEMGAGIAHELNSPLAGILSLTEVLLGRTNKEDRNHFLLEKIKDAAVRSKYIIIDMMTYARPAKGKFEPMWLNESIRATLCLFVSEIKSSSIKVVEKFDPDLPKVYGNQGRVMEVILNIIKNARDALKGSGEIHISTRTASVNGVEYSVAEIRDTGPGIPPGIMDKIFDPFFTTKEKGGGVNIGLGLSLSQSIIKEHGGKIEVENVPGGGASFRVFLPVYKGESPPSGEDKNS